MLCGWKLKVPRQVFSCDMTSLHLLNDFFACVFVRVLCACVCVCVCGIKIESAGALWIEIESSETGFCV